MLVTNAETRAVIKKMEILYFLFILNGILIYLFFLNESLNKSDICDDPSRFYTKLHSVLGTTSVGKESSVLVLL